MKKLSLIIAAAAEIFFAASAVAQICDPVTPVFTVNLTGNPAGTWTSPSIARQGYCCTAAGSDVCIEFIITLDSMSTGISFDIVSGAVPPGALYYQVNCGLQILVGQPICLYGSGPHLLTFCKPGNNPNSFSITSIPEPYLNTGASSVASPLCNGRMGTQGLIKSSITWTSIPPNALYNSFLSCTSGCDTVTVTPSGNFPPYVDYLVCGNPYPNCAGETLCDTIRMFFLNDVSVNITPQNIILCNGAGNTATVTANPSGGAAPYNYLWSTGETTQSISAGGGTYTVTLRDNALCSTATSTVTVTALNPIIANAGNDITVCANQTSINLNGSVQVATGGRWLGGNGTYSPNNTTLNAVYSPSQSEINNGFANLVLETTGNQGCPLARDTVHITIVPLPVPSISGNVVLCASSVADYSILPPLTPGNTYRWTITGGTINGSSSLSSVNVTWGTSGTGTITLTETNSSGCSASVTLNASLVTLPNPVISGNNSTCQFSNEKYAVNATAGSAYSWMVDAGTIVGSTTSSSIDVNWNSMGQQSVTVTETNSSGCSQMSSLPVIVMVRPVPQIIGSGNGCVNSTASDYYSPLIGSTNYFWSVSGGTVMSVNGPNSISVQWNSTGSNSVTLKVISTTSGCDSTATLPVNVAPLITPVIQASAYSGCPPLSVQFSGNNAATGQTYGWTFGDMFYSVASNPTHIYTTSGIFNVILATQNSTGCVDTARATVNVFPAPDASFTHNFIGQNYIVDESILSLNNTTTGANQYIWTFGTGDTASAFEPAYTYHSAGNYIIKLTAINNLGCKDVAQELLNVRVRENFFVPNAFSPNGNDVNDYFSITEENLATMKIVIFNRWGQVIYTSEDKDFRWDGTYNGSPVKQGIYGYMIIGKSYNGNDYTFNGTLTLVK
ncbi:MAG: gliding motility-associated C-terminal domain-containing protein [Bacteroidia bacterium]|nr:gliding motility-associated C-terminal domain-containing protein [Bacteroidia bacterium]